MNFNKVAKNYDSWYSTPFGMHADELEKKLVFKFLGPIKEKNVFDLGCGTGIYSMELAKRGARVIGLDSSIEMLRILKRKRDKLKIELILGYAENLPLKNISFDSIISITAICFFNNPKKAIEEMERVVKFNGKIIIGVLNKWSFYSVHKKLKSIFVETAYKKAKFYSILELRDQFGHIKWDSTLFALSWMPAWLLKIFASFEKYLSKLFKPFGAFIVFET